MNINALLARFQRDGYLHLPGHFDPDLMIRCNARIAAHFIERPDYVHTTEFLTKASTEVIPWFPQREGEGMFDAMEQDELVKELSLRILGNGWQSQYCMIMYSHPESAGQAWHQDCPPDDANVYNLNRLIYTQDIEPAVGGEVALVPESHHWGELPAGDPNEDLPDQLVLAPKLGDCLFIHGHTWHRVLPLKQGHRFSVNFRAAPRLADEGLTDVCVYRNMRYRFSTAEVLEQRTRG